MQQGDKVRLLNDIKSNGKGKELYGKRGELVTVISVFHLPVLIVENEKGRFPVKENNAVKIYKNDKNNHDRAPGERCHN